MKRKEDLRCPLCGSKLKPLAKCGFYYCENPKCKVVKVSFDQHLRVKRVFLEGLDVLIFRSRNGWASYPLNSLGQNKKG